jgi:hypothetical protein
MKPHRIFPAVALAMLWGGHAFASGPAYSYVTTGPGKQVLKIDNSTGAVTSLFTASAGSVTSLSDLTLFSDGKLYVGAIGGNINIIRVDRNGNGFDQLGSANNPKELRFSAYQMLFCNGDGGVRRTDSPTGSCSTPIAGATASPGTGLAFTANGSLLALVNGQLKKVTLDANGQSTGSTVIPIDVSGVKSLGSQPGVTTPLRTSIPTTSSSRPPLKFASLNESRRLPQGTRHRACLLCPQTVRRLAVARSITWSWMPKTASGLRR